MTSLITKTRESPKIPAQLGQAHHGEVVQAQPWASHAKARLRRLSLGTCAPLVGTPRAHLARVGAFNALYDGAVVC
jgi:hypothetical protein